MGNYMSCIFLVIFMSYAAECQVQRTKAIRQKMDYLTSIGIIHIPEFRRSEECFDKELFFTKLKNVMYAAKMLDTIGQQRKYLHQRQSNETQDYHCLTTNIHVYLVVLDNSITCLKVANDTCSYNACAIGHDNTSENSKDRFAIVILGYLSILHQIIKGVIIVLITDSNCKIFITNGIKFADGFKTLFVISDIIENAKSIKDYNEHDVVLALKELFRSVEKLVISKFNLSPTRSSSILYVNGSKFHAKRWINTNKLRKVRKHQRISGMLRYSGVQLKNFQRLFRLGFYEITRKLSLLELNESTKVYTKPLSFDTLRFISFYLSSTCTRFLPTPTIYSCSRFSSRIGLSNVTKLSVSNTVYQPKIMFNIYISLMVNSTYKNVCTVQKRMQHAKRDFFCCNLFKFRTYNCSMEQTDLSAVERILRVMKKSQKKEYRQIFCYSVKHWNETKCHLIENYGSLLPYIILMVTIVLDKLILIAPRHKPILKLRKNKRKYRPLKRGAVVCWTKKKYKNSMGLNFVFLKMIYFSGNRILITTKTGLSEIVQRFSGFTERLCTLRKFLNVFYKHLTHDMPDLLKINISLSQDAVNEKSDIDFKNKSEITDAKRGMFMFRESNISEWANGTVFVYPLQRQSLDGHFQEAACQGTESTPSNSMKYEMIRLSTFHNFDRNIPISSLALAKAGFYFTGSEDECKCFSCGISHSHWKPGDNPLEIHRQLKQDCVFISGQESGNVSVAGAETMVKDVQEELNAEITTEEVSSRNNSGPDEDCIGSQLHTTAQAQNAAISSPSSTFRSTNYTDSVHHNSCSIQNSNFNRNRSAAGSVSNQQTGNNQADGNRSAVGSVSNQQTGNNQADGNRSAVGSVSNQQTGNNQADGFHRNRRSVNHLNIDPLGINFDRPKYPAYAVLSVRVSTFQGWPVYLEQDSNSLAKAGFFYAGYSDYCRCFFCGGGLRNWETGDDPWVEHARWFPKCVFVLQNKGEAFVALVLERHAEYMSESTAGNHNVPLEIPDVQSNDYTCDNSTVQSIQEFGYSRDIIDKAVSILQNGGNNNFDATLLLETIFKLEEQTLSPETEIQNTSTDNVSAQQNGATLGIDGVSTQMESFQLNGTESLIEENQRLKSQRLCRICRDEDAAVAFLPCGHLVCCHDCAPALLRCCVCHQFIKGTVKTWLA